MLRKQTYSSKMKECPIMFSNHFLQGISSSVRQVAILVTPEYEGVFKNGGIGTYYKTLSEILASKGFYVILLLCQQDKEIDESLRIPVVNQIFLTRNCSSALSLNSTQRGMLSQFKEGDIDYENYCNLFFVHAITKALPDAYVYVEFPEMLGLGYRTVQAKRSGVIGQNCVVAVTLHSCQEWLQEAHARHIQRTPDWFQRISHYEQYSFEQADLAFFLSHFLKEKVEWYGWNIEQAVHLPYCFRIIEPLSNNIVSSRLPQLESDSIPLVFFGRLEERKGLLTFLEALKLLVPDISRKLHVVFLGKSVGLQVQELDGVDSQDYISESCQKYPHSIVTDLFSEQAIQLVNQLSHPIVCLTSAQENFPNAALEMGQLPVSIVVSEAGGFQETLGLIERTDGVHWFVPREAKSLAEALAQAISKHPVKPNVPTRNHLQLINQRLLNQRMKYMEQASPKHWQSSKSSEQSKDEARPWILGMTSMEEQLFLEDYAQNQYSGQGEIVELGCWLGSSTISLARGLAVNAAIINKIQRVHTYDLFVWDAIMEQRVADTPLQGRYQNGDSFLDEYLRRISQWEQFVDVCPGDLTEIGWQGGDIECLFVDAMKSWRLANSILKNFFSCLIPELSLIVHQDFAHYYTAWIHLLMYRFRKYLIPIEHPFIYSSRVFRAVQKIPEELLNITYSCSSFEANEVEAAFAYSLDITPENMRPNILAAKVMYFIHTRNFERAKLEFKKATQNLDISNWKELADVKKTAEKYFLVKLTE